MEHEKSLIATEFKMFQESMAKVCATIPGTVLPDFLIAKFKDGLLLSFELPILSIK